MTIFQCGVLVLDQTCYTVCKVFVSVLCWAKYEDKTPIQNTFTDAKTGCLYLYCMFLLSTFHHFTMLYKSPSNCRSLWVCTKEVVRQKGVNRGISGKGKEEEGRKAAEGSDCSVWESRGCGGKLFWGPSQLHTTRCHGNVATIDTTQYYHEHACTHTILISTLRTGLVAMVARSVGRGWWLGGCWGKLAPPKFLSPYFSWHSACQFTKLQHCKVCVNCLEILQTYCRYLEKETRGLLEDLLQKITCCSWRPVIVLKVFNN